MTALAAHVYAHGDVLSALCPILLVLWLALILLGVLGLALRRPVLLDPLGSLGGGIVLLILWAVFC